MIRFLQYSLFLFVLLNKTNTTVDLIDMKILWASIFILLFTGSGLAQERVQSKAYDLMLRTLLSHSVPEISVDSLQKIKNKVVLIDAREPEEYTVSHIPGAIPVGYTNFKKTALDSLDKEIPIVVYCAVGYRSEKISEKLKGMGYKNVSNLYGGIFEWVNQGNVVVNETDTTQKVHAYSRPWSIWLNKGQKVYN